MDRRGFLTKAGLGSAALAALPSMDSILSTPAWADGESGKDGFFFQVVSKLTTGSDLMIISGCGNISLDGVSGGGSFVHLVPEDEPPFPIVATGTWTAGELIGYSPIGNYGALTAGILRITATAHLEPGGPDVPVRARVVCNIGPADLFTPHEEGVTVMVPAEGGLTFEPQDPPVGLTIFTRKPASSG